MQIQLDISSNKGKIQNYMVGKWIEFGESLLSNDSLPQEEKDRLKARLDAVRSWDAELKISPKLAIQILEKVSSFNLTERAKRVLVIAEQLAEDEKAAIGMRHLMLSILKDPDSLASQVLKKMEVDNPIFIRTLNILDDEDNQDPTTYLVIVQQGAWEARNLNHHFIGTEHLLLGMLAHTLRPGGKTFTPFEMFGVSYQRAKTETISLLSSPPQVGL